MRILIVLLSVFCSLRAVAQESQYEQMKGSLDESSLPLVNVMVDMAALNRTEFVPGEIEITDYQRRTDPNTATVRYHCKYRIRGITTTLYDKKSFAVKLTDETGADLDANLFGIREENSWILDAMAIDRIRMRNRVCFDIWNAMSRTPYKTLYGNRNGTEGFFVEVFINGNYHGLYCLTDKIDRKLLSLHKAKVNNAGEVSVRGVLYKGLRWNGYTDILLLSYSEAPTDSVIWNGWELQYPGDYPSQATWQPLMDLIDFCSADTPDETFREQYHDYFHEENLADYAVFTMALNVGDNAYKNTFLSTVDLNLGHCYLLTPWDMDMSLGGNYDGSNDESLASINRYNNIAPFNRLAVKDIDGFCALMSSRWIANYTTLFSREAVARRLDDYGTLFTASGAWQREYEKWNGNPVPLEEDIFDELQYVKDWYGENYAGLCSQFGTPDPQGIAETAADRPAGSDMLMLDGRRVSTTATGKGVYIVNGKKYVVK